MPLLCTYLSHHWRGGLLAGLIVAVVGLLPGIAFAGLELMTTTRYLDFDLSIEPIDPAQSQYRARVLSSPAGQVSTEFALPFSTLELENFLLRVGRPRRGVRRLDSPEMRAVKNFGSQLFATVFKGPVQSCLWRSLDEAKSQGQGLRIRLHVTQAPALADLPWEYLYDPALNRFFAYSTNTPIVRYLDLPQRITSLMVQPPLKVLVMIANPHDLDQLDVEAEWRKVQNALADLVQRGLVTVTRLEQATLTALQRQLRRAPYHIFHFVGHGGFDHQTERGVLLLEDANGRSRLVSGDSLGALLSDHDSLRLVLLNSCEGSRTVLTDAFAGVAQYLVQQGIPAVIAMQFEITDQAAITLAHEFYTGLADGYAVDAALAEARKAIYAAGNDIEWGTPVLYMRSPDGYLFDVTERAPDVPPASSKPEAMLLRPETKPAAQPSIPAQAQTPSGAETNAQPPLATSPTAMSAMPAPVAKQTDASIWPVQPGRSTLTAQQKSQQRRWWWTGLGGLVLLFLGITGYQVYQENQGQIRATATEQRLIAAATSQARLIQVTATALAPQAQATATAMFSQDAAALRRLTERFGMAFLPVPGGTFMLGSPDGIGESDEHPQHAVTVANFWIGQTEVTNAQYRYFVEAGGYGQDQWWSANGRQWRDENQITAPGYWDDAQWNQADYPVVGVSWYEASAYVHWLAHETGLHVRLPSEAEWERAARGDDGRIWPWGDAEPNDRLLNYNNHLGHTSAVGSYAPSASPYGALDLGGNVWEWTSSLHLEYPYQANDGRGDDNVRGVRVLRGGSWSTLQGYVRPAARPWSNQDSRTNDYGFRCVVIPSHAESISRFVALIVVAPPATDWSTATPAWTVTTADTTTPPPVAPNTPIYPPKRQSIAIPS